MSLVPARDRLMFIAKGGNHATPLMEVSKMAAITTNSPTRAGGFRTAFAGFFKMLGRAITAHAEYHGRVRQIERLQLMSDAELAKRGIRRDEIAQHVFRDMFYA